MPNEASPEAPARATWPENPSLCRKNRVCASCQSIAFASCSRSCSSWFIHPPESIWDYRYLMLGPGRTMAFRAGRPIAGIEVPRQCANSCTEREENKRAAIRRFFRTAQVACLAALPDHVAGFRVDQNGEHVAQMVFVGVNEDSSLAFDAAAQHASQIHQRPAAANFADIACAVADDLALNTQTALTR